MGLLDLPQRAYAERAYYALARAVLPKLDLSIRAQRDAYDELREKLSAKYFCNFSVFQSVPDAWAIDQVFPIMPIHRLDERPDVRARLRSEEHTSELQSLMRISYAVFCLKKKNKKNTKHKTRD